MSRIANIREAAARLLRREDYLRECDVQTTYLGEVKLERLEPTKAHIIVRAAPTEVGLADVGRRDRETQILTTTLEVLVIGAARNTEEADEVLGVAEQVDAWLRRKENSKLSYSDDDPDASWVTGRVNPITEASQIKVDGGAIFLVEVVYSYEIPRK